MGGYTSSGAQYIATISATKFMGGVIQQTHSSPAMATMGHPLIMGNPVNILVSDDPLTREELVLMDFARVLLGFSNEERLRIIGGVIEYFDYSNADINIAVQKALLSKRRSSSDELDDIIAQQDILNSAEESVNEAPPSP